MRCKCSSQASAWSSLSFSMTEGIYGVSGDSMHQTRSGNLARKQNLFKIILPHFEPLESVFHTYLARLFTLCMGSHSCTISVASNAPTDTADNNSMSLLIYYMTHHNYPPIIIISQLQITIFVFFLALLWCVKYSLLQNLQVHVILQASTTISNIIVPLTLRNGWLTMWFCIIEA